MHKFFLLFVAILLACSTVHAAEGMISKVSNHSVRKTMDQFEQIVKDRGFVVVARVNHAKSAIKSGISLRPTELLIFGNPKLGSLLMQSNQTIGIDLPLKVLVWEDEKGTVKLAYNDPAWLAQRHGIEDQDKSFAKMTYALAELSDLATR